MEERQTIWDGLPDVEGYISTRHPSSFYKRQHHHEERRAFTTGWMYQASTPTVVDICNILDPGPPPLPPLDTPPWTRSYTTEPFVFLDLNDGSRRTVPLRFQPPPAPQFGGPAHFMTGHGQGWGERGTSEHMFVDEDDDEYMVEVDGEDDGSSVEEIGDAETVMDGHQGPGLRGSFENIDESDGEKEDGEDLPLHETVKRLREEVGELTAQMRRDRLEFERLGSTVAEIMEYLVEERQGSKREQETGSHHFDGGQTRRPSMDNPHPNPPKSIEDYNTAWKAISESKDISNDQHSVIPWPTSSLRASLLSRHQQQRRGITNHRRLPKEISEDIFQLRKWNAFCFFVQAFGLYPTYIHADGIRRGMSAPEEPREGIVFDIRIQGASRAKLNALKAQMVQDKLRWHPDRLKRHAGGFTGDEEEAAKAVLSAVLDSSKACNRCLELYVMDATRTSCAFGTGIQQCTGIFVAMTDISTCKLIITVVVFSAFYVKKSISRDPILTPAKPKAKKEDKTTNNETATTRTRQEEKKTKRRKKNYRHRANMLAPLSLFSVNAVLIMATDDSSRIFAKYYSAPHPPAGAAADSTDYPGANPYPAVKDQKAFEKGLMEKTNKQSSDIILYDNRVVVFKFEGDVMLYVVGSAEENEVMLYNVVVTLRDSLSILLGGSTDKRTIIENYDLVSLAVDEIIDDGIILETDPVQVASRVSKAPAQDAPNMKNIDLSEQGLLNAWEFGKRRLAEQLRQGL